MDFHAISLGLWRGVCQSRADRGGPPAIAPIFKQSAYLPRLNSLYTGSASGETGGRRRKQHVTRPREEYVLDESCATLEAAVNAAKKELDRYTDTDLAKKLDQRAGESLKELGILKQSAGKLPLDGPEFTKANTDVTHFQDDERCHFQGQSRGFRAGQETPRRDRCAHSSDQQPEIGGRQNPHHPQELCRR